MDIDKTMNWQLSTLSWIYRLRNGQGQIELDDLNFNGLWMCWPRISGVVLEEKHFSLSSHDRNEAIRICVEKMVRILNGKALACRDEKEQQFFIDTAQELKESILLNLWCKEQCYTADFTQADASVWLLQRTDKTWICWLDCQDKYLRTYHLDASDDVEWAQKLAQKRIRDYVQELLSNTRDQWEQKQLLAIEAELSGECSDPFSLSFENIITKIVIYYNEGDNEEV